MRSDLFVGGSYELKRKKADTQRSINLMPTPVESGGGKAGMYLAPVPGLVVFSLTAAPLNDLVAEKTQLVDTAVVGDAQTYTITATNNGPDAADGGKIIDDLPAGFTFASCTIGYSGGAAGPASADAAELAAGVVVTTWPDGGVVTLTITGTLDEAGSFENEVVLSVASGNVDPGPGNNTDAVTVEVSEPPSESGIALFGGGIGADTGGTKATVKYDWSSDAVSAGTDLNRFRSSFGGCGNSTKALFAGGNNSSGQTETYTYVGDVVANGGTLTGAGQGPKAVSNETVGVINSGARGTATTGTQRYTLGTDSVAAGTALSAIRFFVDTCGNATVGLFGGGSIDQSGSGAAYATVDKYTYSSDVVAAGTNLSRTDCDDGAIGCATYGVFTNPYGPTGAGVDYSTKTYTYSSDAVAAGTSLARSRYGTTTASNPTRGLFVMGYQLTGLGGMTQAVESYDFGTGVVSAGTNLGSINAYGAGASSVPGGF